MNRLLFAACIATVPWVAHADFIADFLKVRYVGSVTAVAEADSFGYSTGDRVVGTLRVDLRKTPLDRHTSRNEAWYGNHEDFPTQSIDSGFVTTHLPGRTESFDGLHMQNSDGPGSEFRKDRWAVNDIEYDPPVGIGSERRTTHTVAVQVGEFGTARPDAFEFLSSDAVDQEFDLQGENIGRGELSVLTRFFEDGSQIARIAAGISFALRRLTVTTGTCKAP